MNKRKTRRKNNQMKIRWSFKDVICLFLLWRTYFFSTVPILSKCLRITQVAGSGKVMLFASLWCNAYENWFSYDSPLNSLGKNTLNCSVIVKMKLIAITKFTSYFQSFEECVDVDIIFVVIGIILLSRA